MKNNLQKLFIGLILTFFISECYAITINVHSTSSNITGLGFTVNGSKHGGLGTHYHASGMPKGNYAFGLRANGKDVGCFTNDGKKKIKLTSSSRAILNFNGRRCVVKVNSK